MRIQEIAIEGFKSYGDRVKLGPFGSRFTAICGPNGSGKSNCFDSICFAMGFRIGADMRADSLTDLIYQRGQSGVCSASVTITFDNTDKHFTPALYSECKTIRVSRQIALRGRDRFFVNGELKRLTDIEKLFKEAKLNIRAPHQFVIMQGKIQEIVKDCAKGHLLHYLEDCVGTSLFEKEKEKSEKILQEKNLQLKSIDSDLSTLLQPALDKAKNERANYLRWLESGKEILLLRVLYLKHKLQALTSIQRAHQDELSKLDEQDRQGVEALKTLEAAARSLTQRIAASQARIAETLEVIDQSSGEYEQMQSLKNDVVKIVEEAKIKRQTLAQKRTEIQKLTKKNKGHRNELEKFQHNNQAFVEEEEQRKQEIERANEHLASIIQKVDAAKSGVWLDDSGRDLNEVVTEMKEEERHLASELNVTKIELAHNESEVARLAGVQEKGELREVASKIEHWQQVKASSEEKLQAMQLDRNEEKQLQDDLAELRVEEERYSEKLRGLGQRFGREEKIRSKFTNRAQVPGVLMDVFEVKDRRFSIALEEAAKSRLFHVVVDNDETATELFQWASNHGVRVTCLPINRVNNQPAGAEVIKRAKDQARPGDEVYYSLEIVEFAPQFTACIASALNVFVTNSKDAAKRINKLEKWVHNTLTEEGDSYNPTGQISGGSKAGMNNVLRERADFLKALAAHQAVVDAREDRCRRLNYFLSKAQDHKELCSLIAQAQQKLDSLEVQLDVLKSGTEEGRLLKAREEVARLTAKAAQITERLAQLSVQLKPLADALTANVRNAEAALRKLVGLQREAETQQKKAEQTYRALLAERESTIKRHAELKTQVKTLDEEIAKMSAECEEALEPELIALDERAKKLEAEFSALSSSWAAKERAREEAEEALNDLNREREACAQEQHAEIEAAEHRKKLRGKASSDEEKLLEQLRETERESEEAARNCGNDSSGLSALEASYMTDGEASETLERIAEDLASRSKERATLQMRLDKKCIDSLGQIEAEFNALKLSQQKVEKEREAVVELIANIEQQKLKKLQSSFQRVNQYFSNIFSTLLPGANAFMENPKPDFSKGLELAVEFNGVRKRGLQDLSGGQKSLLALSLLLAMLKLNPCPFYVFDEVDAALDSGHTQNLGLVIREYFGESQFLVVSHRENFYSNAEVIFRTSCVNGKSHITRQHQRS